MTSDSDRELQPGAEIAISIVSHGHGSLVTSLLDDLARHRPSGVEVTLTVNIPETTGAFDAYPFPVTVFRNERPKGFAANHNFAFRRTMSPFFCVLNPDIRIVQDPFPRLLAELQDVRVGVVAPRIQNPEGHTEDSARRFPTPLRLLKRKLARGRRLDYEIGDAPLSPDWVAGMFMMSRRSVFAEMSGFDERYFLYLEDVDLCRRLRSAGYDVRQVPAVSAVHEARRHSRRNLRHLGWHIRSMLRFLSNN